MPDHVERTWRHLDTCQFETRLLCRVPRLRLPEGKVWTGPVPWAEKGSRYTLLFEQLAVTVLQAARPHTPVAAWLRLDWDAVQRIMERGSPVPRPPTIPLLLLGRGARALATQRGASAPGGLG